MQNDLHLFCDKNYQFIKFGKECINLAVDHFPPLPPSPESN